MRWEGREGGLSPYPLSIYVCHVYKQKKFLTLSAGSSSDFSSGGIMLEFWYKNFAPQALKMKNEKFSVFDNFSCIFKAKNDKFCVFP